MSATAKLERLTKEVQYAGAVINDLVRENYELRSLLQESTLKGTNNDRSGAHARELSYQRYSLG